MNACAELRFPGLFGPAFPQGKVRDTYIDGDRLIAVTTDRQSAFDRHLAYIPFKVRRCRLTSG